jgi:hypothetical protein
MLAPALVSYMLALIYTIEYTGYRALASPDPAIPTASLAR